MAKHKLSDLIGDPPPQPDPTPEKQTYRLTESDTTEATDLQTLEQDEGIPLYQQLYRKETRLTESQIDRLNTLARRLNRSKRDKAAPRITENTLIRVAVEALLNNEGSLSGDDEDSLLASLLQDP